jgi:glutamine synthetase
MVYTTVAEYIWLDDNKRFRSKTRTIKHNVSYIPEFPDWDYDGSSTGQATGKSSEIIISPVFVCDNPFINEYKWNDAHRLDKIEYKFILCETLHIDGTPTESNTRSDANKIFSTYTCKSLKPWFGLEQEYFIMSDTVEREANSLSEETKDHYCGIGREIVYRNIAEEHLMACIKAGINISGMNAEVSKNQWEFQIGPSVGIKASDELLMARFILERIAEKYGGEKRIMICYEPKPFAHINGSGCHTNFSTASMRSLGGIGEIHRVIQNMEKNHASDIKLYGANNEIRLSGIHETSDYNRFSWGVGDRGVSVRINNTTNINGFGYFEDRRPAANMDPYLVTAAIMANTLY